MLNTLILHANNAITNMFAGAGVQGWTGFYNSMYKFFHDGMGNKGAAGVGIALLVIGIFGLILSIAMHHMNPQSRVPGWFMFLIIGILGAVLMAGIDKPIEIIKSIKDWIMSVITGS